MLLITPYLKSDVSFRLEHNKSCSFRFQHYGSTLTGVWQEGHAAEHLFQTIYVHGRNESRPGYIEASPEATCQHTAATDEKWTTDITRDTAKEDIV